MGFFDFFSRDIAIDLGTVNTLIYEKGKQVVLDQPSIVAIDKENNKIFAVGHEAKKMLGKTPKNIEIVKPLKDGVIADFKITEKMLRIFISQVKINRYFFKPKMVICIPSGITEVEQKAVKDSAIHAGAGDVFLVSEPIAAAIGVGLSVSDPSGNMIIDIGGGTTEIAVLALNSIVCQNSIRIAGDEFDEAILDMVRKDYNLFIGEVTAENIKKSIGSVSPKLKIQTETKKSNQQVNDKTEENQNKDYTSGKKEEFMEVSGRDVVTGLHKTMAISSLKVREAMDKVVVYIVDAVKKTLEETPPQFAEDLVKRGIVLTGGGALIKGLDILLQNETSLPVTVVDNPLLSVAKGAGKILDNIEKYKDVLIKS